MNLFDGQPDSLVCSAKACRTSAVWAVRWNNPKLHTPQRLKVWLACESHRTTLADHLSVRGFLRDVVPVAELAESAADS